MVSVYPIHARYTAWWVGTRILGICPPTLPCGMLALHHGQRTALGPCIRERVHGDTPTHPHPARARAQAALAHWDTTLPASLPLRLKVSAAAPLLAVPPDLTLPAGPQHQRTV